MAIINPNSDASVDWLITTGTSYYTEILGTTQPTTPSTGKYIQTNSNSSNNTAIFNFETTTLGTSLRIWIFAFGVDLSKLSVSLSKNGSTWTSELSFIDEANTPALDDDSSFLLLNDDYHWSFSGEDVYPKMPMARASSGSWFSSSSNLQASVNWDGSQYVAVVESPVSGPRSATYTSPTLSGTFELSSSDGMDGFEFPTTLSVFPTKTSYENGVWVSVLFSLSGWTQTDLDALQVKLTANDPNIENDYKVQSLYGELLSVDSESLSDSITIDDSTDIDQIFGFTDTVSILEEVDEPSLPSSRLINDTLPISSSVDIKAPIYITISDSMTLSQDDYENLDVESLTDHLSFQESLSESLKVIKINEVLVFGDLGTCNFKFATASDTLNISDTFRQGGLLITDPLLNTLNISDSIKTNQHFGVAQDPTTILDDVEAYNLHQYLFDNLTITDSGTSRYSKVHLFATSALNIVDSAWGLNLHLYDSIHISDIAHRVFFQNKSDSLAFTQYIGFPFSIDDTDLVLVETLNGYRTKPTSGSVSIIQILCLQLALKPTVIDALIINDAASGYINSVQPGGTNVDNNNTQSFKLIYRKAISSTLIIQESLTSTGGQPTNCVISE